MICTTAINTSNTTRTQTGAAECPLLTLSLSTTVRMNPNAHRHTTASYRITNMAHSALTSLAELYQTHKVLYTFSTLDRCSLSQWSSSSANSTIPSRGSNSDGWCNVCTQGFTPRPVNQKGAQGEEAGRGIANGGARQRRRRGEMYSDSAYRVAEDIMRDDEGWWDMMRMMWISVLRKWKRNTDW